MVNTSVRLPPYPAYKPSGVEWLGQIPAHWAVKRLKVTVLSYQNGVWGAEPSGDNDIACVRVADFDRIGLRAHMDKPTFRSIEPSDIQTHSLYPGDLLLEGSGGGEKQPVGAVVLYDSEKPAVCSNFIGQLRPSDGFESRFLTYLHFTLYSARVNVRSIKQSIGIQNLDKASYLNEAVALPPLPEQRAIAAFLDRETARIDALVSREKRLIELLQEKRTALITRAVTRGLDSDAPMKDSGVEWLGEMPIHWETTKLRRLLTLVSHHVDVHPEQSYQEIGIRSWGRGIFHKDPVTGAQLGDKRVFKLRPGELVLNIVFAWEGAVAIVSESEKDMIASHRFPTFQHTRTLVDLDYLLMFLQSEHGRGLMGLNSPGAAGRNRTIRMDSFLEEEVPLPPLGEQREIVTIFRRDERRIQSLAGKVREAVDLLKELRTALITAAVTGRIDVREEVG